MGFRKQTTKYSCGAASLQYALTFLGQTVDGKELLKASGTTSRGIDENGIARAAQRYGCMAVMRSFRSFSIAFRHLIRYVQSGQPCILCVDNWKHWMTAAGGSRKGVALFDPGSQSVATLMAAQKLRSRWRYRESESAKEYYFFIAVRPLKGRRGTPRLTSGIDSDMVRKLRRKEDLRQGWNQYLQDLGDIFGECSSRTAGSIPAWRFIDRHSDLLVELVSFWDGGLPKTFYRKELSHLVAVARAHGFKVHSKEEKSVLISLACILSHQTPAI